MPRGVPAPPAPDGDALVATLCAARRAYTLPPRLRALSECVADTALGLLFPPFSETCRAEPRAVADELARLDRLLREALAPLGVADVDAAVAGFLAALPAVHAALLDDARAAFAADPAAESVDEVVLAYPGFLATALYRLAHVLHGAGVPLFPRLLTEHAHRQTGIDIHPGARIGHAFSIDHGTGVVIGETAVVGDRVRLYQGVTLGALAVEKRLARQKRHPTIGDDVVIYANATILGGDTVVGARSVIGGNVWLTQSVPAGAVVTRASRVRRPDDAGSELLDAPLRP